MNVSFRIAIILTCFVFSSDIVAAKKENGKKAVVKKSAVLKKKRRVRKAKKSIPVAEVQASEVPVAREIENLEPTQEAMNVGYSAPSRLFVDIAQMKFQPVSLSYEAPAAPVATLMSQEFDLSYKIFGVRRLPKGGRPTSLQELVNAYSTSSSSSSDSSASSSSSSSGSTSYSTGTTTPPKLDIVGPEAVVVGACAEFQAMFVQFGSSSSSTVTADLTVSAGATYSDDACLFASSTVSGAANTPVKFYFKHTASGNATLTAKITTATVGLTRKIRLLKPAKLVVTPAGGLNFGTMALDSQSEKKATIKNNGDVEARGLTFPDFGNASVSRVASTCQATLGAGKACEVTIRFVASSPGEMGENLQVIYDSGVLTTQSALSISAEVASPAGQDLTFGKDGLAGFKAPGSKGDKFGAMAIQPGGRIIVVGSMQATNQANSMMPVMVGFTKNGKLDTSFSTTGYELPSPITIADRGHLNSILIQSDGKILVSGQFYLNGKPADGRIIYRFTAAGERDTSIPNNGVTVVSGISGAGPGAMALQADGKLVLAGLKSGTGTHRKVVLIRLYKTGALDDTFGNWGVLELPVYASSSADIQLQSDGTFVINSVVTDNGTAIAPYVRVAPNGHYYIPFQTQMFGSLAAAFAIDPSDRLYFARDNGVVARYLANGVFDTKYTTSMNRPVAMALQSDGVAYLVDGSASVMLDTSPLAVNLGTNTKLSGVLVQADGTLLVGGTSDQGNKVGLAVGKVLPGLVGAPAAIVPKPAMPTPVPVPEVEPEDNGAQEDEGNQGGGNGGSSYTTGS